MCFFFSGRMSAVSRMQVKLGSVVLEELQQERMGSGLGRLCCSCTGLSRENFPLEAVLPCQADRTEFLEPHIGKAVTKSLMLPIIY